MDMRRQREDAEVRADAMRENILHTRGVIAQRDQQLRVMAADLKEKDYTLKKFQLKQQQNPEVVSEEEGEELAHEMPQKLEQEQVTGKHVSSHDLVVCLCEPADTLAISPVPPSQRTEIVCTFMRYDYHFSMFKYDTYF
jgi:hypothetical protein